MMKPTLFLLAAAMLTTGVSCSSMGTDSAGRRYYHSAAPIQSKTGLSYKETRQAAHKHTVRQEGYFHSPAPIASKTGLQVAYSR